MADWNETGKGSTLTDASNHGQAPQEPFMWVILRQEVLVRDTELSSQSVSSVAQSYPTPCDPMNCSTPGLPVRPSPTPGVHSNSPPSSRWCHPAISSSVVPFSSCPQSLPASESFPMSQNSQATPNWGNLGKVKRWRHTSCQLPESSSLASTLAERCRRHQEGPWVTVQPEMTRKLIPSP